jgi:hypothetical protein
MHSFRCGPGPTLRSKDYEKPPAYCWPMTTPRPGAIGLANGAEVRFFYLPIQVLPNSIWG